MSGPSTSPKNPSKVQAPTKRRSKDHRERRAGDTLFITLLIWLFPLSLFAYVAYSVAVATNMQPPAWVVNFDWRQAAIVLIASFLFVGAIAVVAPVIRARRRAEARQEAKPSAPHTHS